MSRTLADVGLAAMIQIGGEDIVSASYLEVATASHEEAMKLLGLGPEEMIIEGCQIFKDTSDDCIAMGILEVSDGHCAGHYEGCRIFPLHWGFNFLSQVASLLIKHTRPNERILPQAGGISNAKGTDFVYPGDALKGVVRVKKVMREGVVVDADCYRNGDSTSVMTARLFMAPDLTLPHKPQNASWEEVLANHPETGGATA